MSTGLSTTVSEQKLSVWVQRPDTHAQIAAAVGDIMPADQFISHALVSMQQPGKNGDPGPRDCTPASQLKCIFELAAVGLLQTLGQVALIVRKSKDGLQLTMMPQWQGYKAIMERHPSILEVAAEVVHVADSFHVDNGVPVHSYDPFDTQRKINTAKDIKGGYLTIRYRDGRPPKYHFVPVEKIEKNRACAQTQNVWTKWYKEMVLKTIYRDGYAKRVVPIDPLWNARMEILTRADDAILGNNPARVESKVQKIVDGTKSDQQPEPPQDDDIIDVEPEREPGIDDKPQPPSNAIDQNEADEVGILLDAIREGTAEYCRGIVIPDGWTDAHKQLVANKIEMRLAETKGKGQKSFA